MIKYIFFDIGQVLVKVNFQKLIIHLAAESEKSPDDLNNLISNSALIRNYRIGAINTEDFLIEFKKEINYRGSADALAEAWVDIFEPINENIELLAELSKTHIVSFISNTNPLHMDKIFSMISGLKEMGTFFLSYSIGLSKPDPQIYFYALDKLKAVPSQSVFIDDDNDNITAAEKIGFSVILLDSPYNLKNKLLNHLSTADKTDQHQP